ncbi:MAG: class I SAM-dependent methyltransferase [Phycisphaerales bacterium]|nr:class I SAM-dependent methyltransferase [Phycisphaerales bacterium]
MYCKPMPGIYYDDWRCCQLMVKMLAPARWMNCLHPCRAFLKPDVVYLDPMYPDHPQRSTAARKPMVVLRHLVGDDEDASQVFHWALRLAQKRVVVKRPLRAPELGLQLSPPIKPATAILGKSHRFDVYVVK